jgi:hypothetical protein
VRIFVAAAFAAVLLAFPAAAQPAPPQPQWVPIILDLPKVAELMDDTPMVGVTRNHLMQLIQRWEAEAQAEQARKAQPPAPPPDKPPVPPK